MDFINRLKNTPADTTFTVNEINDIVAILEGKEVLTEISYPTYPTGVSTTITITNPTSETVADKLAEATKYWGEKSIEQKVKIRKLTSTLVTVRSLIQDCKICRKRDRLKYIERAYDYILSYREED